MILLHKTMNYQEIKAFGKLYGLNNWEHVDGGILFSGFYNPEKNFIKLACPKDDNVDFEILRMLQDGRIVVSCNHCNNETAIGELKELEE